MRVLVIRKTSIFAQYSNAACSGSTGGGARFILRKWIDSSGHRENMLTPEWKTIGVGATRNI